jgi:hypothetical protein
LIYTRKLKYKKNPQGKSANEINAKMMQDLVQYSMSLANDSYQTYLCLQFTPGQIATACVFLACQLSGVEPIEGSDWKTVLSDPDVDTLFSISVQVLDLISEKKASDTESVKKIRATLDLMKTREEQLQQQQQQQQHDSSSKPAAAGGRSPPPPPPPPPSDSTPNKRQRVD